jgi:hypothetical protein
MEPSVMTSDGLGTKVEVYQKASETLPERERVWQNAII